MGRLVYRKLWSLETLTMATNSSHGGFAPFVGRLPEITVGLSVDTLPETCLYQPAISRNRGPANAFVFFAR